MDPLELLKTTAAILERLKIPYFVTGSMASMAFGESRLTNDIDIVVELREPQIKSLANAFHTPEYYADEEMIREAVQRRDQFNIIHPSSGLKVDVIVCPDTPFNRSRFSRARRLPLSEAAEANFASPEDIILKKMEFYKQGGSEKHLRDITGILKVSGPEVDKSYIARWAAELGVQEIWAAILRRLES
jgi:hypothetical protein